MTYRLFLFSQLQPASKWNFLCCMQKLWKTIKIIVIIVISTWLCYAAFHTCTTRSTQQFIKFIGSGLFLHLPFVSLLPSGNSCIGNLCVCVWDFECKITGSSTKQWIPTIINLRIIFIFCVSTFSITVRQKTFTYPRKIAKIVCKTKAAKWRKKTQQWITSQCSILSHLINI